MAITYTLIASNTLGSSAASVTFSSIPNTYTDLVLRISWRTDASGVYSQTPIVRFNGQTSGTNYSNTYLNGSGTTASSGRYSSDFTWRPYLLLTGSASTANTFANVELYIPNYLTSTNKPASLFGVSELNQTTNNTIGTNALLWSNTSAITSIKLEAPTDNFVSGSSFFLYGIKNN
jgi:hypothetical protein